MLRHRSRRVAAAMAVAAILVSATAVPSAAYRRPGLMDRVNRVPGDTKDHGYVNERRGFGDVSASANGRYVVFQASDPDLAKEAGYPGATLNAAGTFYIVTQIFRYDRVLRRLEIASLSDEGVPALGETSSPRISDSGRYVVFETPAPNLVEGDTNLTSDVFVRDMIAGTIERVSVTSAGKESRPSPSEGLGGNEASPSISGDGRFIAFGSRASDLVKGDTNGQPDIFLHDRVAHTTKRVSVASSGAQADGWNSTATVSNGGRYVAFTSDAPSVTGGAPWTVVRHDMKLRRNEVVSAALDGSASETRMNPPSTRAYVISHDGRYVAFLAGNSDLVPNDTTPMTTYEVFVRDMRERRTTRVNVTSFGEESIGTSHGVSLSGNGRYVTFSSFGDDLTSGDTTTQCATCLGTQLYSGDEDAYTHDLVTGTTDRMSINPSGPESASCGQSGYQAVSSTPGVSATGRFVSFWSCYDGMVAGDADNGEVHDVYIRDRGVPMGTQNWGGGGSGGDGPALPPVCLSATVCLPPAGALTRRDRDHAATTTTPGADLYGVSMAHRPQLRDLFVRVQVDGMPSQLGPGAPLSAALLYGLRLTSNGVDYEARVQRTPDPQALSRGGASFGLFRTDPATGLATKVATLRGGYGTTGEEVVFAIPLSAIGARSKTKLANVTAYSALGTFAAGVLRPLDSVHLR